MSEELLIRHCSPTLAGLKTGNMFNCSFENREELKKSLRHWNKLLVKKGLRVIPLRVTDNKALLYVYRPGSLTRDLSGELARGLLNREGYCADIPHKCLTQLIHRIAESEDFPHEVGLFLGYPPEDVSGFMDGREDFKCVGVWKVYGDAEAAQRTFAKYRKCSRIYQDRFAHGSSIDRLALAKA